jgi:hypothetical protein
VRICTFVLLGSQQIIKRDNKIQTTLTKKTFLRVLLHICVFVPKLTKTQPWVEICQTLINFQIINVEYVHRFTSQHRLIPFPTLT